ncbi:DUF6480 family protein [Streptomyces nojiriensis]|uniref:DUF6480 family protein n=1 Tax=Streptomyces nojiriensis TaxID=66374 RepID=UPI002E177C69
MSAPLPGPDPNKTSQHHGGVPPGESSTGSGVGPYRPITRGWGKGPLVVICLVALACALLFLAYAIMLNI